MSFEDLFAVLSSHIVQLTITIVGVLVISRFSIRRWPRFTFLLCLMAILKCIVPPVLTSPLALFTLHDSVAHTVADDSFAGLPVNVVGTQVLSNPGNSVYLAVSTSRQSGTTTFATQGASSALNSAVMGKSAIGIWLAGVVILCAVSWRRWRRLQVAIIKSPAAVPEHVREEVARIALRLGLRQSIETVLTSDEWGPAVVGVFQPRLLLPESLANESLTVLTPIIAHELTHVRRHDTAWGVLQFLIQVIWWFHPAVWLISRRTTEVCERCCDASVLHYLKCTPSAYAASLIRVLQLRQSQPWVLSLGQMSASHITAQRLRDLPGYRAVRPVARSMKWLVAAFLAAVVLPGAAWMESRADEEATKQTQTSFETIRKAIASEKWEVAVKHLNVAVEQNEKDERAWFFLGYSLHNTGRMDEAIEAHAKASEFEMYRGLALYNWACALALLDKPDQAIAKLKESIDNGFMHRNDIASDPDLKTVLTHPDFEELRQRAIHPSRKDPWRRFDFWIGHWEVLEKTGEKIGESRVTKEEDGFLLTEKWTDVSGNTGTGMSVYDPENKVWMQTWVDADGTVIQYSGSMQDGAMQLSGRVISPNGKSALSRLTLKPAGNGEITRDVQRSTDGGLSWSPFFEGRYRRVATKQK